MDLRQLIKNYLKDARVMQLATSVDNQPWVCNLHFYADDNFNFYWLSTPTRRHSQEIEQNPKVGVVIKVHEDTLEENYIIGLSAEGEASIISTTEAKEIADLYREKLGKDAKLISDILTDKNPHKFYRLKVSKIVLFDTKNFPENPRQEFNL